MRRKQNQIVQRVNKNDYYGLGNCLTDCSVEFVKSWLLCAHRAEGVIRIRDFPMKLRLYILIDLGFIADEALRIC